MTDNALIVLLSLAAGFAAGGFIGWLLGRRSAPAGGPGIEPELRRQIDSLRMDLAQSSEDRLRAETARATAEAHAAAQVEQMAEFRAEQTRSLEKMREAFASLSAEALAKMQPAFLTLADQTMSKHVAEAKGDLETRKESIAALLKPTEELLRGYQERLATSETANATALGAVSKGLETLTQQSTNLSGETLQLRRVLGSNQARGAWGEETLKRVVEASGMSVHCDFIEQTTSASEDSRPDMIVRLPGERLIIVDSKVPDLDFLSALHESDDAKRSEALKTHAAKLRQTVKALADRNYAAQFPNALDNIVLFLPAESLFSAALEGDRDLIVWAAQKHIVLATPASLIAVLRSVSVSWQQHDQVTNAREIAVAAGEFYSRVATFLTHFDKIRSGLATAGEAYNSAIGSYERSVRPQGERLVKLNIDTGGKALAEPGLLDTNLRLAPPGST